MQEAGEDPLKPSFTKISEKSSSQNIPKEQPKAETVMTKPGEERKISTEELVAHDKAEPWFVVNGEVYDGTGFLEEHPGGADSILISAGQDATEDFMAIHSADGKAKLAAVRNAHVDVGKR
jgi:nitrate reductase (NAD(P)H)